MPVRTTLLRAAAAVLLLPGLPAAGQAEEADPFVYTCSQLLASQPGEERIRANMMVFWSIGYMYGRFGGDADGPLAAAGFAQASADVVNAFQQICPNVPDMPIATFMQNLGDDFERSLQQ
ncbi:MAG: hypothetical protein R3F55_04035 [Alphaproteobacteria bacterium]